MNEESPIKKIEDEVELELDSMIELEQKEVKSFSRGWYVFIAIFFLIAIGIIIVAF